MNVYNCSLKDSQGASRSSIVTKLSPMRAAGQRRSSRVHTISTEIRRQVHFIVHNMKISFAKYGLGMNDNTLVMAGRTGIGAYEHSMAG